MPRLFLSYAHNDLKTKAVHQFVSRLELLGKATQSEPFTLWQDNLILPGERWLTRISHALQEADYGLLLITPAFLASDFIREVEIPAFISERSIPILLRPTPMELVKESGISQLQIHMPENKSFIEQRDTVAKDQFVNNLYTRIRSLHSLNAA